MLVLQADIADNACQQSPDVWCELVRDFDKLFRLVAGRPAAIDQAHARGYPTRHQGSMSPFFRRFFPRQGRCGWALRQYERDAFLREDKIARC